MSRTSGKYHTYISEYLEVITEGYHDSSEGHHEYIRGVQYIVGILRLMWGYHNSSGHAKIQIGGGGLS